MCILFRWQLENSDLSRCASDVPDDHMYIRDEVCEETNLFQTPPILSVLKYTPIVNEERVDELVFDSLDVTVRTPAVLEFFGPCRQEFSLSCAATENGKVE